MKCFDCPRECGVDRTEKLGFCREQSNIRISKIIENFMWEEPCITGEKGVLAIFFSGCNLRCKFCQNYEISHIGKGESYTPKEFKDLLLSYDLTKFSAINLITPSQFSSQIYEALKDINLPIPIVWNSNGYEKVETINKVSQVVDVFLVDFKYYDSKLSEELSCAKDYFAIASQAITQMSLLKENIFEKDLLKQGVLIRHLVIPGHSNDSCKVLDFIKQNIKSPIIALMSQFTPIPQSPIQRKLLPLEFKAVCAHAKKLGLDRGYFQELSSSSKDFIPKF